MTLLLLLAIAFGVLAALAALAQLIGADSRDEIDDTHARRTLRGSI